MKGEIIKINWNEYYRRQYFNNSSSSIDYINWTPRITNIETKPKKKKKDEIVAHPSKEQFYFGNCASIAICSAFDIPYKALKAITILLKLNINDGLSFFECKKIINLLSEAYSKHVEYCPNYSNITFQQQLLVLNKETIITMFDGHLSYSENGEIYDSYMHEDNLAIYLKKCPTGWWKLNK